ncbi:MAG: alpha-2-macroglobulin family protein, partial [Actinomycetota bacterium]
MRSRFSVTLVCLVSLLASQALFAQSAGRAPRKKPATAPRATKAAVKPKAAAAKPATDKLAAADKEYLRKNYKQALGLYREALKQRAVPQERRALTDYRMARCLGYMELWDEAISESLRVSARYPGSIWDARSKSWLMRLYLKAPHAGWKVGERYYRGEDAPETESATPPVSVDLTSEDWRKSVLYGEQSKLIYEKIRDEVKGSSEEADMAADLARAIAGTQVRNWAQLLQWKPPADESWKLSSEAPYDVSWAPPKKVLHLFLLAEEAGTKAQKPIARLAQAVWLRAYQSLMNNTAWRQEAKGERKRIPYPYQDRTAIEILRTLPRDFPEQAEADHALLTVGDWLAEDEQYADAIAAYELLAKAQPDTKWGKAAANAVAATTRVELSIRPPAPQAPGKKAELELVARNVAEVKLTAYSVKLEELIKDARVIARPREGFSELFARLGKTAGVRKFHQGEPVTWSHPLTSKQHALARHTVETPLTRNGAYVVEADAGPVKSTVILVISDLAVIQLVDGERITAMTVNAETGAPVTEASVVIRELYTLDKKQQISAVTVATNEDGLAEKPLAPKRTHSDDIRSFAWKGDRYAFTAGARSFPMEAQASQSAYVYTDRAVYRPGQRVNFRALLTNLTEDTTRSPMAGEKVRVRLSDEKGAQVDAREVTTNEFGSVSGHFQLGSQGRLGVHAVVVALGAGKDERVLGRSDLRIEEYKKPEFQVTVLPGGMTTRTGEPLTARIAARYYFGAPVANAKVSYRVVRSSADPAWRSRTGSYYWREIPEEAVAGAAVTDANGEAQINLNTAVESEDERNRHLRFSIAADVTDASRRTIEGRGVVHAPATQFDAIVTSRSGFVEPGRPLVIDVVTQDLTGRGMPANGVVRFSRLIAEKDDHRPEPMHTEPLHTGGDGRGMATWIPPLAGRYEVRFEATDEWDRKVTAGVRTWVAGDEAGSALFPSHPVELVSESARYSPGSTARVLMVAREPETTVLLTHEAGDRVLQKRVVRITGRSMVLETPLEVRHSPDILLTAAGVRGRRYFRAQAPLRVPLTQKLLSLELTPDKAVYKPGEKAAVKLRARDASGNPARVEFSLGVTDASLGYIASDETPSITQALYGGGRGSELYSVYGLLEVFDSVDEDTQPRLITERPEWSFPSGLGNIEPEVFQELPGPQWFVQPSIYTPRDGGYWTQLEAKVAIASRPKSAVEAPSSPGKVRSNFADQAFWSPAIVTDANGEATVTITLPDNITRWEILARGWSESAQVGEARAEVTATKNLLVRLQSPRFFVERDELVLSANVHNYTETEQKVRVALELGGETLYAAGAAPPGPPSPRPLNVPRGDRPNPGPLSFGGESATADTPPVQIVNLPAGGEKRVDWRVRVERPGSATVRVLAEGESDSDAVELKFPVLAHGVEKQVMKGGSILMGAGEKPGARSEKITLTVPAERAPAAGEPVSQISPSAAMMML